MAKSKSANVEEDPEILSKTETEEVRLRSTNPNEFKTKTEVQAAARMATQEIMDLQNQLKAANDRLESGKSLNPEELVVLRGRIEQDIKRLGSRRMALLRRRKEILQAVDEERQRAVAEEIRKREVWKNDLDQSFRLLVDALPKIDSEYRKNQRDENREAASRALAVSRAVAAAIESLRRVGIKPR